MGVDEIGDRESETTKEQREDPEQYQYYGMCREIEAHKGDFSDHKNVAFRFCNIAFLLGGLVKAILGFWLDRKVCSDLWVALEDED